MNRASDATTPAWRVRGSYFEGGNCDAICPCRSVGGRPGGPSTYGECIGSPSWRVQDGHFGAVDSDQRVVVSLRYRDNVTPTTRWEVVLDLQDAATDAQHDALADIFVGRAGGTVQQYAPAIGTVHRVRRARISLEHVAARKRIDVAGYLTVRAQDLASEVGTVQCGISGFDHPGTELFGEELTSTEPELRWQILGRGNASFTGRFDDNSDHFEQP